MSRRRRPMPGPLGHGHRLGALPRTPPVGALPCGPFWTPSTAYQWPRYPYPWPSPPCIWYSTPAPRRCNTSPWRCNTRHSQLSGNGRDHNTTARPRGLRALFQRCASIWSGRTHVTGWPLAPCDKGSFCTFGGPLRTNQGLSRTMCIKRPVREGVASTSQTLKPATHCAKGRSRTVDGLCRTKRGLFSTVMGCCRTVMSPTAKSLGAT